jgi:hypothetical protein
MMFKRTKHEVAPGFYLVDVKRAAMQLAAGKVAGTCKACGREFRIPNDMAKWRLFIGEMLAHPLEHDPCEQTKCSVEGLLAALDDGTLSREGENKLAQAFLANIDKLTEGTR